MRPYEITSNYVVYLGHHWLNIHTMCMYRQKSWKKYGNYFQNPVFSPNFPMTFVSVGSSLTWYLAGTVFIFLGHIVWYGSRKCFMLFSETLLVLWYDGIHVFVGVLINITKKCHSNNDNDKSTWFDIYKIYSCLYNTLIGIHNSQNISL